MKYLISLVLSLTIAAFAHAGIDTQTDENGVILAGHDAVAYFTEDKPVLGIAEFSSVYNGAIYRFKNAENRDAFNENPVKYAPAYGGYCSTGTSFGKKFEVDGKAFKIVDGQLYVNKNLEVHEFWLKDVSSNIGKAEGFWPKIKSIPAQDL